jgi:hypothetical protein
MHKFWTFNIGTAAETPAEDWMVVWPHHTHEMWFPPNKRPTGVTVGDRAVINGSGGRGFFAVVEVTSTEPERNENKHVPKHELDRWPWILRYKLLVAIRADRHAPSLEDVGWTNPRTLRRNPHVEIDREMYNRISRAITAGAAEAVAA